MAKIVYIDAPKGAGKTHTLEHLTKALDKEAIPYIVVTEPGGDTELNPMGVELRQLIKHGPKHSKGCEFLLFQAARVELFETQIKPRLEEDILILVDRSIMSSLVYQFTLSGVEYVPDVHRLTSNGYNADITFWLLPPKEIVKQRLESRDGNYDVPNQAYSFDDEYNAYRHIAATMAHLNEVTFSKAHTIIEDIDINDIMAKIVPVLKGLYQGEEEPVT